ncbi:MAG TPA: cupin domain-containing protein, partial [Gaiellaceae bacterium]
MGEHVVHWDDVEPFRADEGAFQSNWTDLGRAAGSVTVGVKRVQVDPGARSTPLHMEGSEEEIFFVLDGSGLSWQDDGDGETTYEIRAGDCLVHLAGAE